MKTNTETRERPILFQSEMVQAILDGRKTQTRRVISGLSSPGSPGNLGWVHCGDGHGGEGWYFADTEYPEEGSIYRRCPYGQPGDRLWVRETWGIGGARLVDPCLNYRADGAQVPIISRREGAMQWWSIFGRSGPTSEELLKIPEGWRPSIFMPRWASRLNPEITEVRVQRVQKIADSPEDMLAEGVTAVTEAAEHLAYEFKALWDSINAKRGFGWDVNPLVWAVTFKVDLPCRR